MGLVIVAGVLLALFSGDRQIRLAGLAAATVGAVVLALS